jgi:polyhydroxyalkanoate synthesis regulator phasin
LALQGVICAPSTGEAHVANSGDGVVPILQMIQSDISRMASTLDAQGRIMQEQGQKLASIEDTMSFPLGRLAIQANDIETLKGEVRDLKRRVLDLEQARER